MPSMESVRRIIGRDIIQKYATEGDEGGEMTSTGSFTGGTSVVNIGFKPKFLFASFKDDIAINHTYLATEETIVHQYDYDIKDYNNTTRTVTKQTIRSTTARDIYFTSTGFSCDTRVGTGFYFAIG